MPIPAVSVVAIDKNLRRFKFVMFRYFSDPIDLHNNDHLNCRGDYTPIH